VNSRVEEAGCLGGGVGVVWSGVESCRPRCRGRGSGQLMTSEGECGRSWAVGAAITTKACYGAWEMSAGGGVAVCLGSKNFSGWGGAGYSSLGGCHGDAVVLVVAAKADSVAVTAVCKVNRQI
jgi:hypothetical protein